MKGDFGKFLFVREISSQFLGTGLQAVQPLFIKIDNSENIGERNKLMAKSHCQTKESKWRDFLQQVLGLLNADDFPIANCDSLYLKSIIEEASNIYFPVCLKDSNEKWINAVIQVPKDSSKKIEICFGFTMEVKREVSGIVGLLGKKRQNNF